MPEAQAAPSTGGLNVWGAAVAENSEANEEGTSTNAPTAEQVVQGAIVEVGQSGGVVPWAQAALTRLGYPMGATGTFGPETSARLREFQVNNKVQANGRLGPTTYARLQAAVVASVSLEEFQAMAPGVDKGTLRTYLPHLNASMLQANITTDARKAAYIAQLGHESDGFNTLEEYASGAAYEGREDLGNVFRGDGRRFKGRGPIQITGRDNYTRYGRQLGVDLVANPEKAATPELGFKIAAQYWTNNGLNELADQGRFDSITQRINGGQNGQADRRSRWGRAKNVLKANANKPKLNVAAPPAPASASVSTAPQSTAPAQGGTAPAQVGTAPIETAPIETAPIEVAPQEPAAMPMLAEFSALCQQMATNDATGACTAAENLRARFEAEGDAQTAEAAQRLSAAADQMVQAHNALQAKDVSTAQTAAHQSAETLRALRNDGRIEPGAADAAIARAGRIWTNASQLSKKSTEANGSSNRGEYAVWSTGTPRGGGGVTSRELGRGGNWDRNDFLRHHSDRSQSWAANNIRNAKNQNVQAYDFTFERINNRGQALAGSAHGLELISPWDARVHDVQHTFQGSGGYGKFIALEDIESGLRFEVHHLESVADVRKGGTVDGGDIIGRQGASGNTQFSYATHVDIVGTAEAVEQFVAANQSGKFRTRKQKGGA